MSSWIIRNNPYPQNSDILEMIRNVKSACDSLVHGNDTFYFDYLCIMFQIHYDDVIMGEIASQITSLTIVYSMVYSDADQRKH